MTTHKHERALARLAKSLPERKSIYTRKQITFKDFVTWFAQDSQVQTKLSSVTGATAIELLDCWLDNPERPSLRLPALRYYLNRLIDSQVLVKSYLPNSDGWIVYKFSKNLYLQVQ